MIVISNWVIWIFSCIIQNEYGPDGKLKKVYDDNPNSIVAVVTVNGKKIYSSGDLTFMELRRSLRPTNWGKIDLMKWNHHLDGKVSNSTLS